MKLKVFSDRSYLPEAIQNEPMLFPFWGTIAESNQQGSLCPWTQGFTRNEEIGGSLFEITSLEKADLAVLPFSWLNIRGNTWRTIKRNNVAKELALQFAEKAKKAGKQVVVFFPGDCSDEEIPIKHAIVFRESLYRSTKKPTDFALSGFNEDFVEHYLGGHLPVRQKRAKPTVSFCGYANKPSFVNATLKSLLYQSVMLTLNRKIGVPAYKGHSLRFQALDNLSRSPLLDTNFVVRNKNQAFLSLNLKAAQMKQMRLEFVQNMIESDYVFCCRGAGNFSYRLYEALCCGRIPVFIDTDCVLPYDFMIDWKKYFVWVDQSEISRIAEKVAEFHNSLSPQQFIELQYECRNLWKQWLSAEGFFANFHHHFRKTYTQNNLILNSSFC